MWFQIPILPDKAAKTGKIDENFPIGKRGRIGSYLPRMKKHLFLLIGCTVGLMGLPAKAEETPLGKEMDAMNDAYKSFRRETDPAKGAAQAREAQQAVIRSVAEMPEMIKDMPDSPEKAKASVEYRKMMAKLLISLCEVEEAFLSGKIDEVAKIVDDLKAQKKAGHEKFIKDEE
jgi:soluble cytochrome b562